MKLDIKYEDKDLLIINKPNDLIVYSTNFNKKDTLFNFLINNYKYLKEIDYGGIVHRLDKNTTGLLIIAKNINSYLQLKKDFYLRNIIKKYISVVTGELITGGFINIPISRNRNNRTKMCLNNLGKKSLTNYKIIKKLYLHTYIKIIPKTGRTHQIRLHMSSINHVIVGDKKYRNNSSNYKKSLFFLKKNNIIFERQALHAYKLIFKHPISKKILKIRSEIPCDINNLINNIKLFS